MANKEEKRTLLRVKEYSPRSNGVLLCMGSRNRFMELVVNGTALNLVPDGMTFMNKCEELAVACRVHVVGEELEYCFVKVSEETYEDISAGKGAWSERIVFPKEEKRWSQFANCALMMMLYTETDCSQQRIRALSKRAVGLTGTSSRVVQTKLRKHYPRLFEYMKGVDWTDNEIRKEKRALPCEDAIRILGPNQVLVEMDHGNAEVDYHADGAVKTPAMTVVETEWPDAVTEDEEEEEDEEIPKGEVVKEQKVEKSAEPQMSDAKGDTCEAGGGAYGPERLLLTDPDEMEEMIPVFTYGASVLGDREKNRACIRSAMEKGTKMIHVKLSEMDKMKRREQQMRLSGKEGYVMELLCPSCESNGCTLYLTENGNGSRVYVHPIPKLDGKLLDRHKRYTIARPALRDDGMVFCFDNGLMEDPYEKLCERMHDVTGEAMSVGVLKEEHLLRARESVRKLYMERIKRFREMNPEIVGMTVRDPVLIDLVSEGEEDGERRGEKCAVTTTTTTTTTTTMTMVRDEETERKKTTERVKRQTSSSSAGEVKVKKGDREYERVVTQADYEPVNKRERKPVMKFNPVNFDGNQREFEPHPLRTKARMEKRTGATGRSKSVGREMDSSDGVKRMKTMDLKKEMEKARKAGAGAGDPVVIRMDGDGGGKEETKKEEPSGMDCLLEAALGGGTRETEERSEIEPVVDTPRLSGAQETNQDGRVQPPLVVVLLEPTAAGVERLVQELRRQLEGVRQ